MHCLRAPRSPGSLASATRTVAKDRTLTLNGSSRGSRPLDRETGPCLYHEKDPHESRCSMHKSYGSSIPWTCTSTAGSKEMITAPM
jgi:hypothetical protein